MIPEDTRIYDPAVRERFRAFRERAGLSHDEAGERMKVSTPCIWDIESYDEEIAMVYSPTQIAHFCQVLGVSPVDLFAITNPDAPISAADLLVRIHGECRKRNISLEEFEDIAGWTVSNVMDPPTLLLENISIDGLMDICSVLGVDWMLVMKGL